MTPKLLSSYADSVTPQAGPHGQKHGWETTAAQHASFMNVSAWGVIKPARWAVVVSHPHFWPWGPACWRSLSQHSLDGV